MSHQQGSVPVVDPDFIPTFRPKSKWFGCWELCSHLEPKNSWFFLGIIILELGVSCCKLPYVTLHMSRVMCTWVRWCWIVKVKDNWIHPICHCASTVFTSTCLERSVDAAQTSVNVGGFSRKHCGSETVSGSGAAAQSAVMFRWTCQRNDHMNGRKFPSRPLNYSEMVIVPHFIVSGSNVVVDLCDSERFTVALNFTSMRILTNRRC